MNSKGWLRHLIVWSLLLTVVESRVAAAAWRVFTSAHLEVLSDTGEMLARQRMEKLERFRAAIVAYQGEAAVSHLPTRLILFRNDSEFDPVKVRHKGRSAEIDGLYIADPHQNLIAVNAEDDERREGHVVQHEYVHLLCRAQHATWPFWLNEGIAECLSTAQVRPDHVLLGTPPKESLNALKHLRLLYVDTVMGATQRSLDGASTESMQAFYAESWLMTHLLLFNANREVAQKSDGFLKKLAEGKSFAPALRETLGWSLDKLTDELNYYRKNGRFAVLKLTLTNAVQPEIQARPAAPGELKHWIGRWFLAEGRTNEAAIEFEAAAKLAPGSALTEFGLGLLAEREGHARESVSHLRAARTLDPAQFETLFHLARCLIQIQAASAEGNATTTGEGFREPCELLEECLRLRPDFVPAYDLLGRAEYARGHLQRATDLLVKAITLATYEDATRLELARVLRDGKRPELARVQYRLVASNPRNRGAARAAFADLALMDSDAATSPK